MNLFVLNSDQSVEMSFIVAALDISGQHYVRAIRSFGFNEKQGFIARTSSYWSLVDKHNIQQIVFVGCRPCSDITSDIKVKLVGYHYFDDPDYGGLPSNYRGVSSLGRVLELIGVSIGKGNITKILGDAGYALDLVDIVSAYSCCLDSAFRGDCPGVLPSQISMFCRLLSIHDTAWSKLIRNQRNRIRWLFSSCDKFINLANQSVFDFRGFGDFNADFVREIQMELGRPVIFNDDKGVYLLGAKPWAVTQFNLDFADKNGLVEVKANPDKGEAFARRSDQGDLSLRFG